MKRQVIQFSILSVVLGLLCPQVVKADVTSPRIQDKGKKYTTEKADSSWYGTHSSGRLVEASELRIQIESMLADGDWEKALPKARKAVQLDPGDPQGHIMYARILTQKFYQTKGEPDEKTLIECMHEWEMIRRHDADPTEQWEAGNNVKRLQKIARAIEKERKRREREKEEEEEYEDEDEPDVAKTPVKARTQVSAKPITAPAKTGTAAPATGAAGATVRTAPARPAVSAKPAVKAEAPAEPAEEVEAAEAPAPKVKSGEKVAEKKRRWGIF